MIVRVFDALAICFATVLLTGCNPAAGIPTTATPRPTLTQAPAPAPTSAPVPSATVSAPTATAGTGVPATQVPGSATVTSALPAQTLETVRQEVSRRTGVDPAAVKVLRAESVDWPDSSLGCPQPGMMYAQVITPGYRLIVQAGERTLEFHSDLRGHVVPCG